jgi:hypothetical protein
MPVIYSNNASTTLSSGINDSVTTVPIASASGFPSIGGGEYYFGTIANTNNTKIEVVKVTAGTTSLTVVRGQDGTTAQAFDSGDNFQLRVTAATLEAASKSDVNITGGAIAGAAITNDVIDSQHYATGSIDNEHIADDAIDSEHYADGSIDLAHMSSESVDEDNLYISNAGSNGQFLSKQSGNNGGLTWATPTDTNTNQLTTFTVSATTDTTATTISQGDDLMFTAGTGISCETTADGTVTITNTVSNTDTINMGSGFTVSATTDSNATTITQGDDLMFTAGTGISCETTADGTVTIANTVADTNTTYSAGAGLDLSTTTFSVESDLRSDVQYIGQDTNDYYYVGATSHDWYLDGVLDMRLENDGDLHADGDVIAYSTTTASDRKLKDNITTVEDALDKVKQLNGVEFTWKKDGKKSAGVIAQDVEKVLPQAVKIVKDLNSDDEYKTVKYDALISILVESIKELSAKVEKLENK